MLGLDIRLYMALGDWKCHGHFVFSANGAEQGVATIPIETAFAAIDCTLHLPVCDPFGYTDSQLFNPAFDGYVNLAGIRHMATLMGD